MSLFITSLNSGSNGNCYYIGNQREAILIDAGISCKQTEKRMALLGLRMEMIKAIFISHEHSDHIRGMICIAEKYGLPVFITTKTAAGTNISQSSVTIKSFQAFEATLIGDLSILAFPKYHDAADPHSFIVSYNNVTVGVFTDIGKVCDKLSRYFRQCHAAFLEANYDDHLLESGNYPVFLKNRIRGGLGHLSNTEALRVFMDHKSEFMSHLFLSHLSKENNCPVKVRKLFSSYSGLTKIEVASRDEPTHVYNIIGNSSLLPKVTIRNNKIPVSRQLSIF